MGEKSPGKKHGRVWGPLRSSARVVGLAWKTRRGMTFALAASVMLSGVLPAGAAWVGKHIVDGVARRLDGEPSEGLYTWIGIEAAILVAMLVSQWITQSSRHLLGLALSDRIRAMIVGKATELSQTDFEDPELHNRLERARKDAATRPLRLLQSHFALLKDAISLVSFALVILDVAAWALPVVIVAGMPGFLGELHHSRKAYQLARRRTESERERRYLENILTREDFAKEVKLFQLGPHFIDRFARIGDGIYREERRLAVRRAILSVLLGTLGIGAFYGAYVWVVGAALVGALTIGAMVMCVVVFRQAQTTTTSLLTTIGSMYEDHLYLQDLDRFLGHEVPQVGGIDRMGPDPADGIRFESVSFAYPGTQERALEDVSIHVRRGEMLALVGENGSGKTTLIKLLTGLYPVDCGRILVDGLLVSEWDPDALRRRVGVIFQDFSKFKLEAGENIGIGDIDHVDDSGRWEIAARFGQAAPFLEALPQGYRTRLGRSFFGGTWLSGGQWQKVAVSRAFMRDAADILVFDEPTAAIDADSEAAIVREIRAQSASKVVLLISHRLSTIRLADRIVVLERGRILEQGKHEELMKNEGEYARLFRLQASGYQETTS